MSLAFNRIHAASSALPRTVFQVIKNGMPVGILCGAENKAMSDDARRDWIWTPYHLTTTYDLGKPRSVPEVQAHLRRQLPGFNLIELDKFQIYAHTALGFRLILSLDPMVTMHAGPHNKGAQFTLNQLMSRASLSARAAQLSVEVAYESAPEVAFENHIQGDHIVAITAQSVLTGLTQTMMILDEGGRPNWMPLRDSVCPDEHAKSMVA